MVLLPALRKGNVIVMDNASFHHSADLRGLVEAAEGELLFLPAYSPDLNPIEHIWAVLKTSIRRSLQDAKDKFRFISNMYQCYC